ncbi:MAG: ribose 5-phosphate isomerase B [Geminicoccales bacterium]
MTTLVIASDHAGFELKAVIKLGLEKNGHKAIDLGPNEASSVDYPDMADKLAGALLDGLADKGVLICGTGIGIGIAANRHRHVRAALCHDVTTARLAREHNDANVLCLGARVIGAEVALDSVEAFLGTPFEGGRHQRRVDKLG